ncbi:hypothetical protein A9267_16070 [Shewanella sp. UCD-FRSSP16_17]|uniref:hypothetical protein n=1 Tax=Shewanella sp. UCD-FRSSP16_17 TaxID=1853256 RepID=UPI0007EEB2FA|nr:hypothetical protein [Shewanella sp. UCD-FRSSP16_17]OBT05370.1 hypothetical protein A9267_16070 [Shewanella sp. UCD-FRSSP16_17]
MDFSSFGSAISGAVIGGIITGFFALKSTQKSFNNQKVQSEENEKKLIKGVLQAIHDELETIFERYQDTMGSKIETLKENEPLAFYYPLVSDFFTVYNANCFLIGRIPDNDLRKKIIKTYTIAKGMVDSFRLNNDLVSKWEFSEKLYAESQLEVHKQQALAHYSALAEYGKSLKINHTTFKAEVNDLLRELHKNGVLNEVSN